MRTIQVIQIPVTDNERAAKFYKQLFGWEFDSVPQLPSILQTHSSNVPVMLSPVHDMHRPGGTFFGISAEDIDGDLRKVSELGGDILLKNTPNPMGTNIAIIRDPEGAIIVLVEETAKHL